MYFHASSEAHAYEEWDDFDVVELIQLFGMLQRAAMRLEKVASWGLVEMDAQGLIQDLVIESVHIYTTAIHKASYISEADAFVINTAGIMGDFPPSTMRVDLDG